MAKKSSLIKKALPYIAAAGLALSSAGCATSGYTSVNASNRGVGVSSRRGLFDVSQFYWSKDRVVYRSRTRNGSINLNFDTRDRFRRSSGGWVSGPSNYGR